jgi:N-acetylglutamate synthase-like GNAT family acetyltransferase
MNIVLDKTPSKEDVNQLNQRLLEYNQSKVPNYSYDDFIFKLEDETKHMLAGIHCIVGSGWLYIAGLWVKDSLRKEGFGKKLVDMAENEAKNRVASVSISLLTVSKVQSFTKSLVSMSLVL